MSRPPYDLPSSPHAQLTPDGSTAETATPPAGAKGCYISVRTADAYITFDESTPSSTNGLTLPDGTVALYLPLAKPIKALSSAGASVVDILWIS